jgi:hypothetical protein
VLRLLSHPNVVRLRETFEDAYVIEIVMDLISGGELFEVIVEKGFFSEDDSAFIIRQILLGVLHCHQKKIVHRGTAYFPHDQFSTPLTRISAFASRFKARKFALRKHR